MGRLIDGWVGHEPNARNQRTNELSEWDALIDADAARNGR